jgi:hypothetical protein
MSIRLTVGVHMTHWKTFAAGATIAGSLGLAALGLGSGLANAAPSPIATQVGWSQWGGWGPGHGPGGPGWGRGPGWGPPPPPPPPYYGGYGYDGGYGAPSACVNGPLGLVHVCA